MSADCVVANQVRALRLLGPALSSQARPLGALRAKAEETAKTLAPVLLHCDQPVGNAPTVVVSKDSITAGASRPSKGSRRGRKRRVLISFLVLVRGMMKITHVV